MTQSGDGIVADALIDGAAELAIWKAYLASGGAACDAMPPLELDGFLTGVIVSQEPVLFRRWHRLVWGRHEPLFTKDLHFAAAARAKSPSGAAALRAAAPPTPRAAAHQGG